MALVLFQPNKLQDILLSLECVCVCVFFFFFVFFFNCRLSSFCVIVRVLCVLYTLLYLEEIENLSIFCSYLYSFDGIFYACIV